LWQLLYKTDSGTQQVEMTIKTVPLAHTNADDFQTEQVLPIVGAHFVHDIYTAAVPVLLPALMAKLSLSLTLVGSLMAIMQLPALLNPFIGYLADKISLRYFVILAPAVTATLISSLGFASNYIAVAIILFATGVSVACFHAPAPAMIGRVAGKQVGKGMSFYMAAGELARTVGPLLAVWAISIWTLDGFYRIILVGWVASFILYLRLRDISAHMEQPGNFRSIIPVMKSLFLPLFFVVFFRTFLRESITTYLPIFMKSAGASLWIAGGALSIIELAAVAGALASGTASDWIGRKKVLMAATISATIFMLIFLNVEGWLLIPVLLALGFTALSTGPVLLAMVQDHMPNNRAVGNGLLLMMMFLLRPVALLAIGILGDRFGLQQVYYWSALIMLLSIPAILALPGNPQKSSSV
jgi:FSR family fosmidomycin resistance protein-like MFS transporter